MAANTVVRARIGEKTKEAGHGFYFPIGIGAFGQRCSATLDDLPALKARDSITINVIRYIDGTEVPKVHHFFSLNRYRSIIFHIIKVAKCS